MPASRPSLVGSAVPSRDPSGQSARGEREAGRHHDRDGDPGDPGTPRRYVNRAERLVDRVVGIARMTVVVTVIAQCRSTLGGILADPSPLR
jgi:hypothetical protein